ncbi:MAG: TrgA family protein [Phaeovulum sp.]|uniref:TrgA family protein n=1 Tax=Phaeovulum sp. TaxID=2934796 RepID=UPI00272FBECD|nr:TrgA family protein [Phaeovulum sp.]MDP2063227.1 TrgA family protein [Phaeovulum sp.]MDP3860486.1 TrgA family protein [Phaeovulum sp.]
MPTAAKFFAALFMALTGAATVWLLREGEPGMRATIIAFSVTVPVAAIMGWRECGARVGGGYGSAMVAGIRAMIYMVIGAALVLAVMQMFKLAWSRHYDTPTEAVVDIVSLAIGFGKPLLQVPVAATLVAGGLLTGIVAEWAGRRWR